MFFPPQVDLRATENYLMLHDTPAMRAGLAVFPKMIPDRATHPDAECINQIRRELECWHVPVTVIWPDGDMAWEPNEVATRLIRFLDTR